MKNLFHWIQYCVLASLVTLLYTACGTYANQTSQIKSPSIPEISKVMTVIFENADYQDAMRQPFFKKMGQEGAILQNFHAETHPSQPNYIAMTTGDTNGVTDDSNVTIDVRSIADLIESKGKSWKVYVEDWPGNCFLGGNNRNYYRKHVPFVSIKNIQSSPSRCAHIVDAAQMKVDIASQQLPDYSLYVPNSKNDGHDTGVAFADRWLQQTFGPLLTNPQFTHDMTLVITFDEGSRSGNNQIYNTIWGHKVRAGAISNVRYDHYSLLKTIETGMGLGSLDRKDATASVIDDIWIAP